MPSLFVCPVVGEVLEYELVDPVEGESLLRALSDGHHDQGVVTERGLLVLLLLLQLGLLLRGQLLLLGLFFVLLLLPVVWALFVFVNLIPVDVDKVIVAAVVVVEGGLVVVVLVVPPPAVVVQDGSDGEGALQWTAARRRRGGRGCGGRLWHLHQSQGLVLVRLLLVAVLEEVDHVVDGHVFVSAAAGHHAAADPGTEKHQDSLSHTHSFARLWPFDQIFFPGQEI